MHVFMGNVVRVYLVVFAQRIESEEGEEEEESPRLLALDMNGATHYRS